MKTEYELRQELVSICQHLYQREFIVATDGNVSIRCQEGILITPSGIHKGFIRADDIIRIDRSGQKIRGSRAPSSETRMHTAVYEARDDVRAVIHAHPPAAIALSLANISLAQCLLPEVVLALGGIPTTEYATPGTGEISAVIGFYASRYDAMILDRHGSLTLGKDLMTAFNRLETLEHAAKITLLARQAGPLTPLPQSERDRLISLGRKLGLSRAHETCQGCGLCQK
jgi:L-fuculose-phosphate aldolase